MFYCRPTAVQQHYNINTTSTDAHYSLEQHRIPGTSSTVKAMSAKTFTTLNNT